MAVHDERRKVTWGTPIAILVMTMVFGSLGWAGMQILYDVKTDVTDIKSSLKDLWGKENKDFGCVAQGLARCCKESVECV